MPAGTRAHSFDYAELLADTPELVDRTEGRLDDPGRATSYALADVLNEAMAYIDEAEDS